MTSPSDTEDKPLSPAAQRALAEAEARRAAEQADAERQTELGAPKALNPRAMATGRKRASPTISER